LALLLVLAGVVAAEELRRAPPARPQEECLACHHLASDPGPAHAAAALGCSPCHLGNPYARDKDRAHAGLVRNPGELSAAAATCGRTECHPKAPERVKGSVMASNAGILGVLHARWPRDDDAPTPAGVTDLMASDRRGSLAMDHYAKLCAGCHLWRKRGDGESVQDLRGGGCSACHVVERGKGAPAEGAKYRHARISARVPTQNCARCHSRSGRAGLSYQGVYECEGGVEFLAGGWGDVRRLAGGRAGMAIPADVHLADGGMACIDCHTSREVMGDGRRFARMADQVEVRCRDCHRPDFAPPSQEGEAAVRLARLNGRMPETAGSRLARTSKGTRLYNVRRVSASRAVLVRKLDGGVLEIDLTERNKAHHALPGHERLACQACHSPLVPRCVGCHVGYYAGGEQRDQAAGRTTPGRWVEGREVMRLAHPGLGVADDGSVRPFSPCDVQVRRMDPPPGEAGWRFWSRSLSFADPHSTRKESRSCRDCHVDPRGLGLGPAAAVIEDGRLRFEPLRVGAGPQGQVRGAGRRFNATEVRSVLAIAPCLPCHGSYGDPVMRDFRKAAARFARGEAASCSAWAVTVDKVSQNKVFHGTTGGTAGRPAEK
jgi:hypothetical protein